MIAGLALTRHRSTPRESAQARAPPRNPEYAAHQCLRRSTQGNLDQTHPETPGALLSRRTQTDDPEAPAPHVALPSRLGPRESDRRTGADTASGVATGFVASEDSRQAPPQNVGSRQHRVQGLYPQRTTYWRQATPPRAVERTGRCPAGPSTPNEAGSKAEVAPLAF